MKPAGGRGGSEYRFCIILLGIVFHETFIGCLALSQESTFIISLSGGSFYFYSCIHTVLSINTAWGRQHEAPTPSEPYNLISTLNTLFEQRRANVIALHILIVFSVPSKVSLMSLLRRFFISWAFTCTVGAQADKTQNMWYH